MIYSPAGYYMVHGTSDDEETKASDDLHQNDAWAILSLVLNEDNFGEAKAMATTLLTNWCDFWDVQQAIINGAVESKSFASVA
jgi:hypothetical protein